MNHQKNKKDGRHLMNAWKRYGVVFMAGILLTGGAAGADILLSSTAAHAEEQSDIALNVEDADDVQIEEGQDEAADETGEGSTDDGSIDAQGALNVLEQPGEDDDKKTFAKLDVVQADAGAIVTTDVSNIVENCMPSIVSITTKGVEEIELSYYGIPGVQEYEATGAGSGIIVAQNDEELLVATNSHVVAGSTELTVGFTAGVEDEEELIVPGKIKGMDKNYELAVVAVRLEDIPEKVMAQLKIATLGSSANLRVGEASIAIGNALGYGQSVTYGIISALDREVKIDNFSKELIMTDASINFGNSGGALLNSRGQVIGINVAKETGDSAEGMGYSIPIDTAIPVLQNLINKQTRDRIEDGKRGYLGATVVNVLDDAKDLYDMPEGAFVYEVSEDSAAEQAGIKKGDVITKFDGESVTSSDDLIEKISYYGVGETVTIELQTADNGEYVSSEVEVTLQAGSPSETDDAAEQNSQDDSWMPEFEIPGDRDFDIAPFGDKGTF